MPTLNLKPTDKQINAYYAELERLDRRGITNETAVRAPFQYLLKHCVQQLNWELVTEYPMDGHQGNQIFVDGALLDDFDRRFGFWEAKDIHDDLTAEVERKFEQGYPSDNILFQTPQRAILWQNARQVLDVDLTKPTQLVKVLQTFFAYQPPELAKWERAVAQFKDEVPAFGEELAEIIKRARKTNREFTTAFADFYEKCCQAIKPNLSEAAVEEMLIQHLLTDRIFRTVFSNPDFIHRNVIAREIETVINALTSHSLSRDDFLKPLNHFYVAIEEVATKISDYSQKQRFLNTVYEQFFQGFSVKTADTHGIVYTPQPIVNFIVRSVEHILQTECSNRSLSDRGVHILDPFVGTGNFIVRIMQEIRRTALEHKYMHELHCNELMPLPYYIASMNIEYAFFEAMRIYRQFENICLDDTFKQTEELQFLLFTPEHTERVKKQRETDMFVIIGNPPYNVGQGHDSDNNPNPKYKTLDARIAETYAKDSKATLKAQLYDPYVRAIRWALDRIGEEGVVAFITNNSFLDGLAFDGMRKHLADDCDAIYILDLGGNARKGLKVSDASVFGIQVGVSINLFVKTKRNPSEQARIFYHRTDERWNKEQKFDFLKEREHIGNIAWQTVQPDKRYTWLTEGLHAEFETFIPIGTKAAKATKGEAVDVIFKTYSNGVKTNRDAWVYNFNRNTLDENMSRMIDTYNEQVFMWQHQENLSANSPDKGEVDVADFVVYDDTKIKWDRELRQHLKRGRIAEYTKDKVRNSLYRPFTKSNLYFDRVMNNCVYVLPSIFPTPKTEAENRMIWIKVGQEWPMFALMVNKIPDLLPQGGSQSFPFYTYNEDGTNRRENITDWALAQYRAHYRDDTIGKWDIFHHTYALLHHPDYRERYEANLKRDLPRLPYTPDFWAFAKAGQRLGEIHIGYEEAEEYPLDFVETPDTPLDWRVEKMRLSKDKTSLIYNEFSTLDRIPAKAFEYRLGNRSALEWVIDQYCVKTEKRSGIVNDPNREDDPQYIVKLIGKVIAVSLETLKIVEGLPGLGISTDARSA